MRSSLARDLLGRMLAVSAVSCIALTVATSAFYLLQTDYMRASIMDELASRAFDEATDCRQTPFPFDRRPDAYAYRIYDRQSEREVIMRCAANAELFVQASVLAPNLANIETPRLSEGLTILSARRGAEAQDYALLTRRQQGPVHSIWVQVLMRSDPAWIWIDVLEDELLGHVLVPAAVFVPALLLAIYTAVRRSLRPLSLIAQDAEHLSLSLEEGRSIEPFRQSGLAWEFGVLVGAINALLRRLDEIMVLQRQFSSDVAHELRTPLSVLRLEAESLPDPQARRQFLEVIDGLALRVAELLQFSQTESMSSVDMRPVDLVAVARQVCLEMAPGAANRQRYIEFGAAAGTVMRVGNPGLLAIAIRNLIDNAVKFSPPGGAVHVEVTAAGSVLVRDSGTGVPAEQQERIFERFRRSDAPVGGGTGIGLALTRRIARAHNGEVAVHDGRNGGAEFEISFGEGRAPD
jgi:signal transduction histidine kinase